MRQMASVLSLVSQLRKNQWNGNDRIFKFNVCIEKSKIYMKRLVLKR